MDYEKKYNEALKDVRAIYPNLKGDAKLAVEHAFPELRESEDERIRKELVNFLQSPFIKENLTNEKVAPWLAYLEKQKETHYTKRNALFDKCVAECDPEIMQKVSDEIDEMLEKEQKPTSTEDMPYITDEHFYEREPADSFKYKLAKYMTRCCTKKEGPYGYEYGISAETILKMAEEELLKRGVVQKPAEWSEEDEKFLEHCSDILDGCGEPMCALRLKSLRPSWKPSEVCYGEKRDPDPAGVWKPSEEQMKHLQRAINCYESDWGENKLLRSLIYDLKKLM